MAKTKIGINGFGRIGRCILRILSKEQRDIELVAINDLFDPKVLAHLLKYDTVHGRFTKPVKAEADALQVDGSRIAIKAEKDPAQIPWGKLGVDVVLECTGLFTGKDQAEKHLKAGAKAVIISAPAKDPDGTFVMGVNHRSFDPAKHRIISNASCTTNCLAPVAWTLLKNFGIVRGLMTTVHSYTNDQRLLDLPHKDLRRSRAAAGSMIPTTTGAAKAVHLVIPELAGKMDGLAIRVPTMNVSVVDLVVETEKDATVEAVNQALRTAAEGELKGIMGYESEPLVSVDFNGDPRSAIVDASSTFVTGKRLVKVLAWYDNEWGFSNRMVDLTEHVAHQVSGRN
ncbi:MAG: type I glyceraldehyde-3-phosphate dehydrogenase [Nitrospirae bacterium]|nr:type I glyceraldehyde-3-phosphate dehydrogenase [Nitrospirota bacterium]